MSTIAGATDALDRSSDPGWLIEDDVCDPMRQGSREARFNVSNGFLATRYADPIDADARRDRPPRAYVAGLFDTLGTGAVISGLVAIADWLALSITANGAKRLRDCVDGSLHRVVLDMRRGVVLTESRRDVDGSRFLVRTLHFASLGTRGIGMQLVEIRVENGGAVIVFDASLEERNITLIPEAPRAEVRLWRTEQSGKQLAMAMRSTLAIDGRVAEPSGSDSFSRVWTIDTRSGQTISFERYVAVGRTEGAGESDAAAVAAEVRSELETARQLGSHDLVAEHEARWAERWNRSDVLVAGDAAAQRALRFAIYHLTGAVDPTDERVSIGARALSGEDYHGHVFWDTEIYLVPFYIMTWPEAARALLMYRFHTLGGAREKAVRMGWRGALYAWESADTGDETAPAQVLSKDGRIIDVLSGTQEQHISADVAYTIWQYWQATRDESFMLEAGAEILLETARFWVSRATLEADGKRHIRGIIGPDEYHEHVDDNAFTNVMARFNIRRGLDVAALLRDRWPDQWVALSARVALGDAELAQWPGVADAIVIGLDAKTGLYEEFTGYFELEDIDLAGYADRTMPMDVVLGRERIQHSQVVKQADVVALLALLPEEFEGQTGAANFRYYEPRCDHGSSLSRGLHSLVAARLGYGDMALRYFESTAAIDLSDERPPIGGGIHIAAQGGVWLAAVFGFSGLSLRDDGLSIDPHVPAGWGRLTYPVQWRGRKLAIDIDAIGHRATVTLLEGEPMRVYVQGAASDVSRAEPLSARLV